MKGIPALVLALSVSGLSTDAYAKGPGRVSRWLAQRTAQRRALQVRRFESRVNRAFNIPYIQGEITLQVVGPRQRLERISERLSALAAFHGWKVETSIGKDLYWLSNRPWFRVGWEARFSSNVVEGDSKTFEAISNQHQKLDTAARQEIYGSSSAPSTP